MYESCGVVRLWEVVRCSVLLPHNLMNTCMSVCVCVVQLFACANIAGLIQLMQYYYQCGSLYRLRALGERRTMDITVGRST